MDSRSLARLSYDFPSLSALLLAHFITSGQDSRQSRNAATQLTDDDEETEDDSEKAEGPNQNSSNTVDEKDRSERNEYNHVLWADNIILPANSTQELEDMAQYVTEEIYKMNFKWKSSSLEFMTAGSIRGDRNAVEVKTKKSKCERCRGRD